MRIHPGDDPSSRVAEDAARGTGDLAEDTVPDHLLGLEMSAPETAEDQAGVYLATSVGIDLFNATRADISRARDTWAFAIWKGSDMIAGATGSDSFNWTEIRTLWVDEAYRGYGIGRDLVVSIETRARALGHEGIEVNTLSFQAPGFYEALGFDEVGRIPGRAGGAARIYFAKPFTI